MLLPIGTDNPLRRSPVMNYCLIAANVAVFVVVNLNMKIDDARAFYLHPDSPMLYQFITYAFLHAGWGHIIGNMFFLYVFGNNVNEKLGNLGYLLLYLGGAIFSGIGHSLLNISPVLGASGAVAAITGSYMVLFPNTNIQVLYWLFFIGTFDIRALYFILFKLIVFDNIVEPNLSNIEANVAFGAHIAGYIFGILVPMLMIAAKLLPHSQYDLWAILRRWHRRQQYANMASHGYDPFGTTAATKKVKAHTIDNTPPSPEQQKIMSVRAKITEALAASDLALAAQTYLNLLELDPKQTLPQQQQLDVANKLMHTGQQAHAAQAYEEFIEHYPRYPFLEQIQLMAGLIYCRYLANPDAARKHLTAAMKKLTDPGQKQMCQEELDKLPKTNSPLPDN